MIFSSRLKLRGPDKSTVTDGPMIQDHAEAEQYGHQGLRNQPDDSPAYYYYRIILVHKGKEFANLIINEEEVADRVLERLKEIRPEIQIGLDPNTDYSKPRFS